MFYIVQKDSESEIPVVAVICNEHKIPPTEDIRLWQSPPRSVPLQTKQTFRSKNTLTAIGQCFQNHCRKAAKSILLQL